MALAAARLIPAHAGKTSTATSKSSADRAHPRSRGENHSGTTVASLIAGSSPLTRGKPLGRGDDAQGAGLIPAHAGKTTDVRVPRGLGAAHPRSRGENGSGQ